MKKLSVMLLVSLLLFPLISISSSKVDSHEYYAKAEEQYTTYMKMDPGGGG